MTARTSSDDADCAMRLNKCVRGFINAIKVYPHVAATANTRLAMNELRNLIAQSRATTTAPKRPRRYWGEHEHAIALDMRLTGNQAAHRLGCSRQTIVRERSEWQFE